MEIRNLSPEEQQALDQALAFASRIAGKDSKLSAEDVNVLYQSFLDENIQERAAVIALGIAFGQLFIDDGQFEWVRINDEYGEETVIAVKGKMINIGPISMIEKRLDDKIELNVETLVQDTLKVVQNLIDEGNYQVR